MVNQATKPLGDLRWAPTRKRIERSGSNLSTRLWHLYWYSRPRQLSDQGADYIHTRSMTDPAAAFKPGVKANFWAANFATNWGSVGFFRPLTIDPDYWDRGVGKRLIEPHGMFLPLAHKACGVVYLRAESKARWSLSAVWICSPGNITAIMARPVKPGTETRGQLFSELSEQERVEFWTACRDLTNGSTKDWIPRSKSKRSRANSSLTRFRSRTTRKLVACAACHCGEGTEAGTGACYVKFAAVKPGPNQAEVFANLLSACDSLAARRGLSQLVAGVNTARLEAYQQMLAGGFRTLMQGVAMHRADDSGYDRPGSFVIDDWR